MPTYTYRARDLKGRAVSGSLSVMNEQALRDHLRQRSLYLTQADLKPDAAPRAGFHTSRRVRLLEIVIFCRQFSGMLHAGVSMNQTLDAMAENSDHPLLRQAIDTMRREIVGGASLSTAMKPWTHVFPEVLISLIIAGETAGTLAESLETAAAQFEREQDLREKVGSAFVYPSLVLGAATLVVGLMLIFVVPVFARIYQSMNASLPILTRLLIATSAGLLRYGPLLAVGGVGGVLLVRRYCRTEAGRDQLDQLKLRLPLFGPLTRKVAVSRFVRTLAAMIHSGVSLPRGLEIAAIVTGNRVLARAIRGVILEVMRGAPLSAQLASCGEFPPMVTRLVAVGETSGALERMLSEAARLYDREVEYSVKRLTTMLEPILTMCLSVVIGIVVMALYLPIFGLVKR